MLLPARVRRAGRGVAALLCLGLVAARASSVRAQEQVPAEPQLSSELQTALERADERFVQQDFAGALALLEPACAGTREPACAFALGAVHHALGHCEPAAHHYRQYRELAPTGQHTEEVLPALAQLEARCGGNTPAASVAPAATSRAPSLTAPRLMASPFGLSVPFPRAVPYAVGNVPYTVGDVRAAEREASDGGHHPLVVSLLGLAAGSAATALTTGIMALSSAHGCRGRSVYDEQYHDECEVREPRYRSLALGFGIATGVLLASGIAVWWLDARSEASVGLSLNGTPELRYHQRF